MAAHDPRSPLGPNAPGSSAAPYRSGTSGSAYLRLTHAQRDEAAEQIKTAYTEGKLDEAEFEERLDLAMAAKVHADLEPLLGDIAPAPQQTFPSPAPADAGPRSGNERLAAAGSHVSGYFLSALGPLLVLLVSDRSSTFVRRHATEALNYQLTFVVASIVLLGLSWLILPLLAWLFLFLGWIFLPVVAGVASLAGGKWKYPFTWRPVQND
ncbi:putative Tic20 family protein [Haloactinospora alba]|uniref:Putative Tic20 family protein n=1 Tax=Haloactinospora alba TaxID=405555 RepID=A0A543N9X3_9ACTN|nr:DUF1707 and DUF4870 domain-containing protein [Haloactinospora alba]TQN28631.1 putative Tic20 family protein [Haloactinospora alba]